MKSMSVACLVVAAFVFGLLAERLGLARPRITEKPHTVTTATATSKMRCSDGTGVEWDAGPDGMCHPRDVSYTKPIPADQPSPSLTELFTAGVLSFVMCGYVDDNGLAQPLTAKALRQGRP